MMIMGKTQGQNDWGITRALRIRIRKLRFVLVDKPMNREMQCADMNGPIQWAALWFSWARKGAVGRGADGSYGHG